jgi:hypothetical protein
MTFYGEVGRPWRDFSKDDRRASLPADGRYQMAE